MSIFLIGQNLDKPFWGEHDWNGVRYGNIARNYLRYGLVETKLGQVENSGPAKPYEFEYYTHYPPLLPLTIGLSYKIFGIWEWSTRLIPTLATAGSIVLIFLLGSNIYGLKIGVVAALSGLFTPMVLYFGKNPVHEPLTLFFILLSFWGYLEKRKFVFLLGLIFAQITAWAGYFLIPALTLTFLLRKDFSKVWKLIPYWILSIAIFILHLLHTNILTGSISGGNLFESLLQRSGIESNVAPLEFSLSGYLNQLRLWFSTLYTLTLTILAILWLIIKRLGIKNNEWPIFALGMVGVIYAILFSSSVFIHNYLIFYFLPFLALSAGSLIKKVDPALIIFILILIFFERRGFLDALNRSYQNKFAVDIAIAISKQTDPQDTILISPLKFSYSAEKFLKFYSDRKLIFADNEKLDYDYIVKVNQDNGAYQILKR